MSADNVSAMVTNTVNILRDNLHDRYDSGFPVLKELIQNANDAGASRLYISKSEGLSSAEHPLLKKPALLVFNDGEVKDEDLKGIISVAQGGKTGKAGVIGKFGLGMKSIFHFCDMFFYVAFMKDQHKIQLVNPFIDPLLGKDPYHEDWDILSQNDSTLIEKEVFKISENKKKGLFLWIPLRDRTYNHKILSDVYEIEDIWKQDSNQLRKNIALSLAALDISTPCIVDGKRTLEKVDIETQEPKINLEFKLKSKIIYSDKNEYCKILKSEPLFDKYGRNVLRSLIAKDKFTKISFVDGEGNEKEIASYDENQFVSMAIVKFLETNKPSLNFNWCSYLPLNSKADSCDDFVQLDSEYHFIIHANFAIDSGRRNVVDFTDCINKNIFLDLDNIEDDRAAQSAWNKTLIRYFILPKILEFVCSIEMSDIFMHCLYSVLCKFDGLGFYCLDKGFAFKEAKKWTFYETGTIQKTALKLIQLMNKFQIQLQNIKEEQYYSTFIKICDYIQNNSEGINWAIVNSRKAISNDDIAAVSKIISSNDYPLLFLPTIYSEKKSSAYKITDVSIVINFLLCFEKDELKDLAYLYDKVGFLFECLCEDGCLDKELCSQIYADINIQQFIPLFELSIVNDSQRTFSVIYKTYKQVCEISEDYRLFSNYGNDGKNAYLQKYHKMFPEVEIYMISGDVARSEFFLKDQGDETFFRFQDPERQDTVRALNHKSLDSIMSSMEKHIKELKQQNLLAYSDFIRVIQTIPGEICEKHIQTIRAILAGKEVPSSRALLYFVGPEKELQKAFFFEEILKKISVGYSDCAFINPGIEVSKLLFNTLNIQEVDLEWFERRLGDEFSGIQTLSAEEKEKLASYIESPEVFGKLPIHKTINDEFVSIVGNSYDVFLENEICSFPNGYKLPEKVKLVANVPESSLQKKVIPILKPENIVNIILTDHNNDLGNPNGIRIVNFLIELLSGSKILTDTIWPNSTDRRWIPVNSNYFSLNEIINNNHVNKNIIDLCDNLILSKDIPNEYQCLKSFFLNDNDKVLRTLINHAKKDSEHAWPWFDLNHYASLIEESNRSVIYDLLIKSKDPLFTVISEFKSKEETIDYVKQIPEEVYVTDKVIIDKYKIQYLINLCSDEIENQKVEEYKKNHLTEIISTMDYESVKEFIKQSDSKVCLPSKANIWKSIDVLVNFDTTISDLGDEHALCDSLHKYFPSSTEREGEQNSREIQLQEFITKVSECKNKKLWGAFCYIISTLEGQRLVWERGNLFEKETKDSIDAMRLPKPNTSSIILHDTVGNYCLSLTANRVELKDAANVDTVFFKEPIFENSNLRVDLFDNFIKFSAVSIETAIRSLLDMFGITNIPDSFYKNLASPDQMKIDRAINMIFFPGIFNTLKILKVNFNASKYRVISENHERFLNASEENDLATIKDACDNVRKYIENNEIFNGKTIQEDIRQNVINFIKNEEYKERCILFELFQNADDAYCQLNKITSKPYFNVVLKENEMTIEHSGRPINQYMVGSAESTYKSDLVNMLTIGWSDKSNMSYVRQTGKFGYGFKTIYFICDEPHIISGDYDFVIKAGLYPKKLSENTDYTDKTSFILKLNQNGQKHKDEIINEFQNAAKYQVLFAKKIRKISCYGETYEWNPDKTVELQDLFVEINNDFIVFRTKPIEKDQFCLAFRKSGNQIVTFDDNAPKIWCMAPLLDFPNIGFALSANFKTNTGRQTLALENQENTTLINNIATMFANALEELWNMEQNKELVPSLVNVTLIGTTKSPFEPIPKKLIEKFLGLGFIPDGISKFYSYERQELYSLSATYFNDHFKTQFDTINEANNFISTNSKKKIQVITQIAADELKDLGIESKNPNRIVFILDKVLENENEIEKQKEILMNFSHASSLYDIVQNKKEKLSDCKLIDDKGELIPVGQIYNLSEGYGNATSVLNILFNRTNEACRRHDEEMKNSAPTQQGLDFPGSEPEPEPEQHLSFSDVYTEWKNAVLHGEWEDKVNSYYNNQLYPEFININDLYSSLICENPINGKMPEAWTIILLLSMTQSLTAWGHSDSTNRNAIRWLYSKDLIQKFSEGMELQKLYDEYLEVSEADESYLRHFECLLRIYKIRKDFEKFYNLLSWLPKKQNLEDITQFLVTSSDPELSGMAIKLSSSKKSLRLGISLLIRDLIRCGFWKDFFDEEEIEKLYKFAYMPKKIVLNSMSYLTDYAESQQIFTEIINQLPEDEYKQQFISYFDLPFIILGKNWS